MRMFSAFALLLAGVTSSVTVSAQTSESVRQEITEAEDAWRKARIAGDVAFLERFYAKEGRIQGLDGKVQTRASDIALFASGKIKPKFINHGPLDIGT